MSKLMLAGLVLYGTVAFFGLHGAACGMHVAAVERLRTYPGHENDYRASYTYCKIVSAPLRSITE
jgi:hypothetical protein